MSSASATAGSPRRIRLPKPLHLVAALAGAGLLILGISGKQQATREAEWREIVSLRDQLQRHLEDSYGTPREDPVQASAPDSPAALLSREIEGRILRFRRRHRPPSDPTSSAEEFELRLAAATAANAAKQFSAALGSLAAVDETEAGSAIPKRLDRVDAVLQVQGDSFFGLNQWKAAADRYQQIVVRQPDRVGLRLRLAECQSRLGERAKAAATLAEAARILRIDAERDLQQGRFDSAVPSLERALEALRKIYEEEGQAHLDRDYVGLLTRLAWVYAAAPDREIRNAAKARQHAQKACEISQWQSFRAVEVLAAAFAEARDFKEAARLQGKAIELAPPGQRGPLQATLEGYARQVPLGD